MIQRLRGALVLLVAMLLGACATVPSLDREMLRTGRAPTVVLEGAHGPLSHAQSEKILADLKKRSPETSIFDSHVAVEEALAGNTLSVGNRAVLLQNGQATYASMLQAIRGARDHIHLESYIFEGDEVGQEFAQALAERRRAGVQVRVLYDAVGSLDTPHEFFDGLRAQGVEVVAYNPLRATTVLTDATRLNHRDHRKLTIVDGRVAFLGGINISSVYTASSSPGSSGSSGSSKPKPKQQPFDTPWRDTQVRLEGPVVADLQRAFIANWESQSKQKLEGAGLLPKLQPQGHELVRAIPASPDMGPNPLYVALISAIESADTAVNLTIAYFVPHVELMAALKAAAARGVRVRIILPSRTDSWLVFNAGRSFYDEMLEAGIQIFERRDRLLHSKTASIDGVWATVGSTNLDWRSLVFNDELNAVVLGPEFAAQLDAAFEQDIANSQAITLAQWEHRPLADRMREVVARTWAHML
jgi:cardiolipin synthase A/B